MQPNQQWTSASPVHYHRDLPRQQSQQYQQQQQQQRQQQQMAQQQQQHQYEQQGGAGGQQYLQQDSEFQGVDQQYVDETYEGTYADTVMQPQSYQSVYGHDAGAAAAHPPGPYQSYSPAHVSPGHASRLSQSQGTVYHPDLHIRTTQSFDEQEVPATVPVGPIHSPHHLQAAGTAGGQQIPTRYTPSPYQGDRRQLSHPPTPGHAGQMTQPRSRSLSRDHSYIGTRPGTGQTSVLATLPGGGQIVGPDPNALSAAARQAYGYPSAGAVPLDQHYEHTGSPLATALSPSGTGPAEVVTVSGDLSHAEAAKPTSISVLPGVSTSTGVHAMIEHDPHSLSIEFKGCFDVNPKVMFGVNFFFVALMLLFVCISFGVSWSTAVDDTTGSDTNYFIGYYTSSDTAGHITYSSRSDYRNSCTVDDVRVPVCLGLSLPFLGIAFYLLWKRFKVPEELQWRRLLILNWIIFGFFMFLVIAMWWHGCYSVVRLAVDKTTNQALNSGVIFTG
jgi:hypothetical protein